VDLLTRSADLVRESSPQIFDEAVSFSFRLFKTQPIVFVEVMKPSGILEAFLKKFSELQPLQAFVNSHQEFKQFEGSVSKCRLKLLRFFQQFLKNDKLTMPESKKLVTE
jgi:hypothetical protein